MARLDKHDKTHHELFDENTSQVGSLGDVVEAHAGDAVFLTPDEKSVGGADAGESDFESEMIPTDPDDEEVDPEDMYTGEEEVWGTDQTGTVEGIARGFGTHLPQDLGRDGFHVEELPDAALKYQSRVVHAGEELDDYDDDDDTNGNYDPGDKLALLSQPGMNSVDADEDEPMPDRIGVRKPRPRTFDDRLDATREIK